MYQFFRYYLLYFMYCVLGYLLECGYCSIKNKKIILNRGFLIGPYLPIYGNGAMLIILLLKKYLDEPITLFIMSAVIATVLEYLTSFTMEKVFKARWWDYSDKSFNINGRVCLENSLLFGIGSILIMYVINPYFKYLILTLSNSTLIIFGIVFLLIYLFDVVISINLIYKISKTSIYIKHDVTEQINEKVHKLLKTNFNLKLRLIDAFPSVKKQELYKRIFEILNKNSRKFLD